MKRLLISVVVVLLLGVSAAAQELYKIQFYDSRSNVYEGLLAWYGPSQASLLRVRYVDSGSRSTLLVEQQITFVPVPNGFLLRGSNPRFITAAPAGYSYAPDSFAFTRCPNGFFPCITAIDESNRQLAPVSEFRPVLPAETGAFLRAFGFSNENTERASPRAVTLHLIVVADTDASDIGRGDEIDAEGITSEFRTAANQIGVAFQPTVIRGDAFSKSAVLTALNNLNPGPNDIVVFAYTGHGFRLAGDTDAYPRLSLSRNRQDPAANSIAASEVFQILKGKGARLNITLVDACNSNLGEDKLRYEGGPSQKFSAFGISGRATAALFLNVRANIIVAAASKGERAGTDAEKGAYFIRSFLDAFRTETSMVNGSDPSWRTIISNARDGAYRLSRGKQTAVSFVE